MSGQQILVTMAERPECMVILQFAMARTKAEEKAKAAAAPTNWKRKDPWTLIRKSTVDKCKEKLAKKNANNLARVAEMMNNWVREENTEYGKKQQRYREWVTDARETAAEQQETIHLMHANQLALQAQVEQLMMELDTERSNKRLTQEHGNHLADVIVRVRGEHALTRKETMLVNMYKSTPLDVSDSETESEFEVEYEELLMAIAPRQ